MLVAGRLPSVLFCLGRYAKCGRPRSLSPAMSFTLVFPSNAQPERYANTAASYQTDLETPIDLTGQ